MKKSICLAISLFALNLTPVFGQSAQIPSVMRVPVSSEPSPNQPTLTKFNLDFPGGTPGELVAAIEKATGKALNIIIPYENADVKLPSLKMNSVVVPQLFSALGVASRRTISVPIGNMPDHFAEQNTSYGFDTADNPTTDTSIWYFSANRPSPPSVAPPEKICRQYYLEPYLNRGFTVDDITTAIQTGWKMLGDTSPPDISFHKETKLLIAVGERDKMQVIDDVLKELAKSGYKSATAVDPTTGLPLSTANPTSFDPATGLPLSTTKPNVEKSGK